LGIVVAKLDALRVSNITNDLAQNVNFAIKASIAIDFLEAHNVTVETVANTQALAPADIAERAGAVYIQCNSDDSKRDFISLADLKVRNATLSLEKKEFSAIIENNSNKDVRTDI
jgi:hypothetical protein